jgi:hypothetical protein
VATDRDWADGFFAQAVEDLSAAQAAFDAGAASAFCMLMQMVFEKLAKAAFARGGTPAAQRHQVAARLVAVLRRTPGSAAVMIGGAHSLHAVEELENAHPAVVADAMRRGTAGQYPQLEYPWVNPATNQVEWPAKHLPIARRVANPEDPIAAHLLKSARALVKHFDTLFP